ncbi:MAG: hypothetical protein LBE13_14005, partial [Bacteroidales bacterium]|nr:hypothetical protein [Bacteroidales bacterium]
SLIAAGRFDDGGNFIDNGRLSLSTETLTYSSLSSTVYSQSKSISKNSEYVFGNGIGLSEVENSKDNLKENLPNMFAVIGTVKEEVGYDSASYWGYSMDNSYSSTKVISTIGQGNLVVKDTENSDELTGLNRDINSMD